MNKRTMLLIASMLVTLILAGLVLGAKTIVLTQNKEYRSNPEFFKSLGDYFAEKNDYANAIIAYENSLLLADDSEIRNNLAVIYHEQGLYDEAISQLRQLLISGSDNPSYHYDLAVNLVDNFRNTDDKKIKDLLEALEQYEQAEALEPSYANASENIAVLKKVLKID